MKKGSCLIFLLICIANVCAQSIIGYTENGDTINEDMYLTDNSQCYFRLWDERPANWSLEINTFKYGGSSSDTIMRVVLEKFDTSEMVLCVTPNIQFQNAIYRAVPIIHGDSVFWKGRIHCIDAFDNEYCHDLLFLLAPSKPTILDAEVSYDAFNYTDTLFINPLSRFKVICSRTTSFIFYSQYLTNSGEWKDDNCLIPANAQFTNYNKNDTIWTDYIIWDDLERKYAVAYNSYGFSPPSNTVLMSDFISDSTIRDFLGLTSLGIEDSNCSKIYIETKDGKIKVQGIENAKKVDLLTLNGVNIPLTIIGEEVIPKVKNHTPAILRIIINNKVITKKIYL